MLEILENILDKLNLEYRKINKNLVDNNEINNITIIKDDLEGMSNLILEDVKSLLSFDLESIRNLIPEDKLNQINNFNKQYNEIIIVLKAIYERHLDIKITLKQQEFINSFVELLKETTNNYLKDINKLKIKRERELEKLNSLIDRIDNLQEIIQKIKDINDTTILNREEVTNLYNEILKTNLSYNEKKELLISIHQYNIDRQNNVSKQEHLKEENVIFVSIEEVKELFAKYNKEIKLLDKEIIKNEVISKIKLDVADEILQFLKDNKIINNFNEQALLTICLYSDLETITERYNEYKNENANRIIYQYPSLWVRKAKQTENKKRRRKININEDYNLLYIQACRNSYEQVKEIEQYLKSLGFNISFASKDNLALLILGNIKTIEENYNTLLKYGIFEIVDKDNFAVSSLSAGDLEYKCDRYIELGLLHPVKAGYNPLGNYFPHHPTIVQWLSDRHIAFMASYKEKYSSEEYYNYFSSTKYLACLNNTNLKQNPFIQSLQDEENLLSFKEENFAKTIEYIPNYELYEGIIQKNQDIKEFSPNYTEIILLDQAYKVNDYVYEFDNIAISRLKVIKIYNQLQASNTMIDKDGLLYAITKDSYLSTESIKKISACIGYELETRSI